METLTRILWKFLYATVLTAFVVMLFLVISQVFFRYILRVSVPWTEEAARWFYAWQIFLGSAIAAKEGLHLRATFLVDRLPARLRTPLDILTALGGILFLGGVIWGGVIMVRAVHLVEAGSFSVSTSYLYLSIPVSLTVMLCFTVKELAAAWRALGALRRTGEDHGRC
ncbi:MAG: TRAP transporter small permease [Candidatus Methylomirabilota bacterium]